MDNASSQQPRPLQMGAKGAYIVRLLMVGDSACGKTSLVLRFDQNVFSTKFVTTIGVDYRDKMVKVRQEMGGPTDLIRAFISMVLIFALSLLSAFASSCCSYSNVIPLRFVTSLAIGVWTCRNAFLLRFILYDTTD